MNGGGEGVGVSEEVKGTRSLRGPLVHYRRRSEDGHGRPGVHSTGVTNTSRGSGSGHQGRHGASRGFSSVSQWCTGLEAPGKGSGWSRVSRGVTVDEYSVQCTWVRGSVCSPKPKWTSSGTARSGSTGSSYTDTRRGSYLPWRTRDESPQRCLYTTTFGYPYIRVTHSVESSGADT